MNLINRTYPNSHSPFTNSAAFRSGGATPRRNAAKNYFRRHAETQAAAAADAHTAVRPGQPFVPRRRGSTAEAAQILGCSTSLVRWLVRTGELQHVERPGKRLLLLDMDEVHNYRLRKMEQFD